MITEEKKYIPEGWKLLVNRNSSIKKLFKKTDFISEQYEGKEFQESFFMFENYIAWKGSMPGH